jgi:Cd2+/Zn2+-exporting ATPase
MYCLLFEKALSPLDEVTNPKVNFSTGKLTVGLKSQNDINQVTQTVRKLGYDPSTEKVIYFELVLVSSTS